MPNVTQLDPRLQNLLAGLRWRIRAYIWAEGAAVGLIWLGLTFWIGWAVDYLPVLAGANEMPRGARAVLLAIVAGGLAVVLYRWVLRRTFVRLADRSMAVLLERRYSSFRDSLVTAVELTERPDHAETFDPSMLDRTSREALDEIPRVRLRDVFNFRPLVLSVVAATILLAPVLAFTWLNRPALTTWVQRLYLLQDQPWPRSARIEVVGVELLGPEDAPAAAEVPLVRFQNRALKAARGSNLRLKVRADVTKRVPKVCTIHYRTVDGERGRVTMNRMKPAQGSDPFQPFSFSGKPLQGILSTVSFDVVGYDCRLRDYTVEVVDSPAIVGTELDCVFPAYMVDERLSLWLPRTVELTNATQLPRGTDVTIRARTNKPLRRVDLYNVDTKETRTLTIDGQGDDRQRFQYRVERLQDSLTLDVTLYDVDDVVTERPQRLFIAAVPDESPRVDVRLRGIGTAVTPDVLVPIDGTIVDDYAVAKAWFDAEVVRETAAEGQLRNETLQEEFPLAKDGQAAGQLDFRELRSRADGLTLRAKDKIQLSIKAADKCDLAGQPNEGSGDRYQLDVVTPDLLLAMLEARELGLRRRLEQIIEEMTQARDYLNRVRTPDSRQGLEPDDAAGQEPGDAPLDARRAAERAQSLRLLRVQQSLQQSRKSAQELLGVAVAFRDIREELINNRVDTEDRKRRLQELIADPMQQVATTQFPELEQRLVALEKLLLDDLNAQRYDLMGGQPEADAAVAQANAILAELERILQQMLDLETFNELLDIVRQLIKDQERVMKETSDEREKSLLRDLQDLK